MRRLAKQSKAAKELQAKIAKLDDNGACGPSCPKPWHYKTIPIFPFDFKPAIEFLNLRKQK